MLRACERFGLCPFPAWGGIDGLGHGERALLVAYGRWRNAQEAQERMMLAACGGLGGL